MPNFITPEQFEPTRLRLADPNAKTSEKKNADTGAIEKYPYHSITISYDYRQKNNQGEDIVVNGPLVIKFPACTSEEGMIPNKKGTGFSIKAVFDLTKKEVSEFVKRSEIDPEGGEGVFELIYKTLIEKLLAYKSVIPSHRAHKDVQSLSTMFKYPMYFPADSNGTIIPGRNPNKFIPLFEYNKGTPSQSRSDFYPPKLNATPLSWSELEGSRMEIIPYVELTAITVIQSGATSLKTRLLSATVISITAGASAFNQTETINTLLTENPNLANEFDKQMELVREQKEKMTIRPAEPVAPTYSVIGSLPGIGPPSSPTAFPSMPPLALSSAQLLGSGPSNH